MKPKQLLYLGIATLQVGFLSLLLSPNVTTSMFGIKPDFLSGALLGASGGLMMISVVSFVCVALAWGNRSPVSIVLSERWRDAAN